ncbi:COQ9 family protein [Hellea balneolensis]|uniref:COQ9 family protein n=1 Tax=Hellea balneolensis TaxID=287478 RepID=UPI00041D7E38|nr:COQ9 family protein [Hellea balneolensis]
MNDASYKARVDILNAMLPKAAFDGWTQKSLRAAVKNTDLPKGAEELYFPDGPLEVIRFWSEQMNKNIESSLAELDQSEMKIRDKVTAGVLAAMYAIGPHEEAARRALSRLTLPGSLGQGPRQLWSAADTIWRAIGDTSTDGNYYSKRTILAGVIASTLTVWLSDEEPQKPKARKFLDDRIANVMSFEKAKLNFKKRTANVPNPAEILGVLRYGGRKNRRRRG